MWNLFGYVAGDYDVKINTPDDTLTLKLHANATLDGFRRLVAHQPQKMNLLDKSGIPVIAPFTPDPSSYVNQAVACIHRFGCEMPKRDPQVQAHFMRYAKAFITQLFEPLRDDELLTFDDWLSHSKYSGKQRTKFAELRKSVICKDSDHVKSKSFIKDEGYAEPKNARAINSYTDESKVLLGPLVHSVDQKTYKCGFFVKGTNPKNWPETLEKLFGDEPVMETDFSSFEAHHFGTFAEIVHFWMNHMIKHVATENQVKMIRRMMLGVNTSEFKHLTSQIHQRLMSGALWTSSGNGVLNLLIMSYLQAGDTRGDAIKLAERMIKEFVGRVEGDDGITLARGNNQAIIDALGIKLKLEVKEHFTQASFCGITCDRHEMSVLTDPKKVIRNFFWLPAKWRNARESVKLGLLRAKALSYKYNFNNCPIVGPLCQKVCDLTKNLCPRDDLINQHSWMQASVKIAVQEKIWLDIPQVTDASRAVVDEHFGISPEVQMKIEHEIASSDGLFRLSLFEMCSDLDIDHARNFTSQSNVICLQVFPPPVLENIEYTRFLGKKITKKEKTKLMKFIERLSKAYDAYESKQEEILL